MKKIISLLIPLLLSPILTFAISLNDLTAEVYRYQYIGNYDGFYHYVDSKSVHNKGFRPPWDTKEVADIYVVDQNLRVIVKLPCKVLYKLGIYHGAVLDWHSSGVWDYNGNKVDIPKYRYVNVRNCSVPENTAKADIINAIYHIQYGENYYRTTIK